MKYNSPPTTIAEQLQIINSRGMTIPEEKKAEEFLHKIGYYRFSGYALHFEYFKNRKRTHCFKDGTSFEDVRNLYDFDSKLRSLIFDAVSDIEIAFRTQLCLVMSLRTKDSHWPLNHTLFIDRFDHERFEDEIKKETERSRETFIENYKSKYTTPELPASWMLMEIVSFGSWSRVFSSLKDQEGKKEIAHYFQLKPHFLQSWIHSLTVLRNLCAHHARIWNASLTIRPSLTTQMERAYPFNSNQRNRIILMLDIICELLKPLGEYEEFLNKLNALLKDHPDVSLKAMGLKTNHIELEKGVRG